MKQKYSAKDILNELRDNDSKFIINQDRIISDAIMENINSTDWGNLLKNNSVPEMKTNCTYDNDISWYYNYMEQLNDNKNIAHKIPQNTSNRFMKRAVNRLMRVSTQYQEVFNNALVGMLGSLVERMLRGEKKIQDSNAKLELVLTQIMEANAKVENEVAAANAKVENELAATNEKIESIIAQQVAVINEKINKEIQENVLMRIDAYEEAMRKRISDDEKWIEAVNARVQGSEQWLEALTHRVESDSREIPRLRSEVFAELKNLNYSSKGSRNVTDDFIFEPKTLPSYNEKVKDDKIRLNLGSGLVVKEGYVNVDCRELMGVDIVSDVRKLPFGQEEVDEILAAHLLEHFETEYLEMELLPYWRGLLKPDGILRIIVPNIGAMIDRYNKGEVSFDILRKVVFGGHEYADNYHYTMFNKEELTHTLKRAGFSEITVVESERLNDICYEMEVIAKK